MPVTTSNPNATPPLVVTAELKCVVCKRGFDFIGGEVAIVLRHVAYYYDFAHDGQCLATALDWIFPEPGYDGAAFGLDQARLRIVRAERGWALVEHADGSYRLEVIARELGWENEPGGAEFPEHRTRLASRNVRLARQHVGSA